MAPSVRAEAAARAAHTGSRGSTAAVRGAERVTERGAAAARGAVRGAARTAGTAGRKAVAAESAAATAVGKAGSEAAAAESAAATAAAAAAATAPETAEPGAGEVLEGRACRRRLGSGSGLHSDSVELRVSPPLLSAPSRRISPEATPAALALGMRVGWRGLQAADELAGSQ